MKFHFLVNEAKHFTCAHSSLSPAEEVWSRVPATILVTIDVSCCFRYNLDLPVIQKYPKLRDYVQALYSKRKSWALCFRHGLPTRGTYEEILSWICRDCVRKMHHICNSLTFIVE